MTRYSASADEHEIVDFFFTFHETKVSPKKTKNLVIDFLVSVQAPQSASVKAFS